MRYASIDIETTGLHPQRHQVLEVAVVLDDLLTPYCPVDELPRLELQVLNAREVWSPVAYAMHGDRLSAGPGPRSATADAVGRRIAQFLNSYDWPQPLIVAGKNVAGFDLPFLRAHCRLDEFVDVGHRVLDPAMLYLSPRDDRPPSTATCLERAGLATSDARHRALDDALDVVRLIRAGVVVTA